jgi:transcriptional regulator with XRE-family HTH domain
MEGGSRMDALGKRLQGFRLENGWSKRTTAKQLGVSIPSIIRWEEGISEPNDYNRYKIERLLIGHSPAPARRRIVQLSLFPRYVKETTEELT